MTTMTSPPRAPLQPAGSPFVRLVKAEFLKIRTTNAWWLLGIGAFVFVGLALLLNLFQAHDNLTFHEGQFAEVTQPNGEKEPPQPSSIEQQRAVFNARLGAQLIKEASNVFTSGQFFGLMFVMLLGVLIVTNEFHHQTATATFLTTPHRTLVILSKFVAGVIAATILCLVTMIIDVAVGSLFLSSWGFHIPLGETEVLRTMGLNLLTYVIWMIIGIGLGVLIRSQIGATITATVLYLPGVYLSFIAIFLIHYLINKDWVFKAAVLLPTLASGQLTNGNLDINGVFLPGRWVAAAVLIGWGLLFGAIGTLITRKRDIS